MTIGTFTLFPNTGFVFEKEQTDTLAASGAVVGNPVGLSN
jgi:hypothetical protein